MKKAIITTSSVAALVFSVAILTTTSNAQQDVVNHDTPELRPLPEYILDQDREYFSSARNVAFLGESGIGEYWQYNYGSDTCVAMWDKIDVGYVSISCEETSKVGDKGIASTYMSVNGDEIHTQDAWFTGDVDSPEHGDEAVVKLRHDIVPDAGSDPGFKAEEFLEELQEEKVIVEPASGGDEVIDMIQGEEQKLSVD